MSTGDAHVFRFFVEQACAEGDVAQLSTADVHHLHVLRLAPGAAVEIVDPGGVTWDGAVAADGRVTIAARRTDAHRVRRIELIAGALTGNRFDELVDGSVQAGADRITPLVANRRDGERLTQRRERLTRIAQAAAKQAKRTSICAIDEPIDEAGLLELEPGIVLDSRAALDLVDVLAEHGSEDVRLLVGPADGLDAGLLDRLMEQGWSAARLGPSILRAELAAAVTVAISSMQA